MHLGPERYERNEQELQVEDNLTAQGASEEYKLLDHDMAREKQKLYSENKENLLALQGSIESSFVFSEDSLWGNHYDQGGSFVV